MAPQSAAPRPAPIILPPLFAPAHFQNKHTQAPVRCGRGRRNSRTVPQWTRGGERGGKTCRELRFIRAMIGASSGGGLSFALLPRLGEHRRETHYCSLWNAGYDCPRSKFALVFAVFGNGRL